MNKLIRAITAVEFFQRIPYFGRRLTILTATAMAVALSVALNSIAFAANPPPVQIYFVPLPETQLRTMLLRLYSSTGSTIRSVVSIVVTGNDALVYYDHWEDGYELDMANPTQASSEVWGDGNVSTGAPPGCASDACDVLDSGDVIPLENDVPLPRNPTTILFDGRDKIGVTKNAVVARAAWPTNPGSVMADAVEAPEVKRWGLEFKIPVGQNVSADAMFEYTGLMVTASQNGTQVQIDRDGNGSTDITQTLNEGEVYFVDGSVNANAHVMADKPIIVNVLTGDVGARYETRWFTIYPLEQWSNSTYSPFWTTSTSAPAHVFLYNPNAAAITIHYETLGGTGSFDIAAGQTYRYSMPQNTGAHFYTTDGNPFFGVGTMDSDSDNSAYDWGFSLIPEGNLTTEAVVGWAPGTADDPPAANGSPIWVVAAEQTTLYVDFDGNPTTGANTDPRGDKYDVAYTMNASEARRIFDTNDNDQTGTHLYTLNGALIAAAWGQDSSVAQPGNPYLDMGYTVLPLPAVSARKDVVLFAELINNGFVEGSETLLYTITVRNDGTVILPDVVVSDTLPVSGTMPIVTYVTETMQTNGLLGYPPDDVLPRTPFPLDEGGYNFGTMNPGDVFTLTFQVVVTDDIAGIPAIQNQAEVDTIAGFLLSAVSTPLGGTDCVLTTTNSTGAPTTVYIESAEICLRIQDTDENTDDGTLQTITAKTFNLDNDDYETMLLTETGLATGIFTGCIQSSDTFGQAVEDGLLYALAGDLITAEYKDPDSPDDVCEPPEPIQIAAETEAKYLYLTEPGQGLDRIDPVATGDTTTANASGGGTETVRDQFDAQQYDNNDGTVNWTTNWVESGDGGSPTTGQVQVFDGVVTTPDQNYWLGFNGSDLNDIVRRSADLSGASSATLTMDWAANGKEANEWVDLQVSASSSGPFVLLERWDDAYADGTWDNGSVSYDISSYISDDTTIRFINNSVNWSTEGDQLYFDNIQIEYSVAATVFTQTLPMAADFKMPKPPNIISATVYVDVTSGTMPGSPDIEAVLTYPGGTIVTMDNPTLTDLGSGIYALVWMGATTEAITVSAGSGVSLTLTNNESGVAFDVLYDSATYPSRVKLPADTVINLDSLNVYDAAYPGGAAIDSAFVGQTVYIRGQVSDPFGFYDIVTATLVISSSCGSAETVVMTNTYAAVSAGAIKTYEYPWQIPNCRGIFTVTMTSFEGYEGLTDSGLILFVGDEDDTGTPSVTQFQDASGESTGTYVPNETVCVQVTDSDQNLSATTVETVSVTITSASGDREKVTLTETGANTGIFRACVTANDSDGDNDNNGILYAGAGDQLTVNYVDPNDDGDTSNDSATVVDNSAPGVSIGKTLVSPADGIAVVGDTVRYDILVSNAGNTELATVRVTDTFSDTCLAYQSASIAPNTVTSPTLTWNNIGPLAVSDNKTIEVYFKAIAACDGGNRAAVSTGGGPTDDIPPVPVTITKPGVTVQKTKLSPGGSAVTVGDTVVYRITITNSGTTDIISLPLQDNYSAVCLTYQSAAPAATGAGGGIVLWNDLGALNQGLSTSVDVTFTVAGPCAAAVNTARVEGAIDENGDPVPADEEDETIVTVAEPPEIAVGKRLMAPAALAGLQTVPLGDVMTFTMAITNTGPNAITRLVVTDTYNSACMNLLTWNTTPTQQSAGQVYWNTLIPDEPPLLPGETLTLTLTFSATTITAKCTNVVTATGRDRYDQDVDGKTSTVGVSIQPTVLRGTVTDSVTNNPIPGATVVVTDSVGHIYTTTTDASGMYTFTGTVANPLEGGAAEVTASAGGYTPNTEMPTLTPGATNTQNLVLAPATALGVVITPNNSGTGIPGTVVTYTHTIENTGNTRDTYTITVSSNQGYIVISNLDMVTLDPGQSATVVVSVTVPSTATAGIVDQTTITVTSQTNPTVEDSAINTTIVGGYPAVELTPDNTRGAYPGETITYTHQLQNTGNITDTFNLTYGSSQGYIVTLYVNGVITTVVPAVPPDGSVAITVVVQVPSLAVANTLDTITITATSTLDARVWDVAYDFTSINPLTGGTITPDPLELRVGPDMTLYFVQNWRNLANREDRGNITVYGIPAGWDVHVLREATSMMLNPTGVYTDITGLITTHWITVATESNGDGRLDNNDIVYMSADTNTDGIPDTGSLGISGTLTSTIQVILVVTVPPTETVGVYVLTERGSSNNDWQDNHASLAYNDDAVYHDDAFKIVRVVAPDHDDDGIPDHIDLDDDNDGIPDVQECLGSVCPDTDGDGVPDHFDLDSDNDGIPDITEAGGSQYDTDNDGVIDSTEDVDGDGLMDVVDPDVTGPSGGTLLPVPDTDHDGNPDCVDLDADNDGIPDVTEAGRGDLDADHDGVIDNPTDNDDDGLLDIVDPTVPQGQMPGNPLDIPDTDNDGHHDYQDLDSDNDGIPDVTEAGGDDLDTDNDGMIDNATDNDNDGLPDVVDPTVPSGQTPGNPLDIPDTDNDGHHDYQDLDSDNDGIPDVTEAGRGDLDADHDGVIDNSIDNDDDGLLDIVDPTVPQGQTPGNPLDIPDTDNDGHHDYQDLDSDNDGIPDVTEAGGDDLDTDNDGVIDDATDNDNDGLPDVVDPTVLSGQTPGDPLDVPDTDEDNYADYVDIDADDDGIPDNIEAQPTVVYIPPSGNDSDGDGLDDAYDPDSGGTPVPVTNTDATDQPDYLDLDSDNDRLTDQEESDRGEPTGVDSDEDGLDDGFDDNIGGWVPNDGITVPADSTELPDKDGNVNSGGDVDYRDPDLCFTPVDDYEVDNFYTAAEQIATDGTVLTRTFHVVNDKDWVRFYAWAGRVYTLTTSHLDADVDTVLQLYDVDGATVLYENDDYLGGSDASRIVWTAPANGWYYARVTHFDQTYDPLFSDVCGNYYLIAVEAAPCVVEVDSYEPDSLYTQARSIMVDGRVVTRSFEMVADKDWVRFEAVAGQVYTITTSNLGAALDTVLQLYDQDGATLIEENDDYVANSKASRIVWTAPKNGVYYVRVTHFDSTYDPNSAPVCGNSYNISVLTPMCHLPDVYEPDNYYTEASEIKTDGDFLTRTFGMLNDKDWMAFRAMGGQVYTITTAYLDADVDTVLHLYDLDGATMLRQNDDYKTGSKASQIVWVAPRTGVYYIRVTHFDHTYDPRYALVCGGRYALAVDQEILGLTKLADTGRKLALTPGDLITYTILVWNKMNMVQSNIVITDYIPLYTTYITGSAQTTKGTIVEPDPLVVKLNRLEVHDYVIVTFQVAVNADAQGHQIVNRAFVSSNERGLGSFTPIVVTETKYYVYLPITIRE
ncbi:MAG: DUF11 domain-containing protein [Anaerolineae bacterium]|nr:DUF11 domain-containing protein [Anaerolineae bacterium]